MTIDERIARLQALKELVDNCQRNYEYYTEHADRAESLEYSDYYKISANAWQVVMMELNKLAEK